MRLLFPIILGSGAFAYDLDADAGSYGVTGSDASLEVGLEAAAGSGAYALSGADASLEIGLEVAAEVGSYELTGSNAMLAKSGIVLPAAAGAYVLTGGEADLCHARLARTWVSKCPPPNPQLFDIWIDI